MGMLPLSGFRFFCFLRPKHKSENLHTEYIAHTPTELTMTATLRYLPPGFLFGLF